MLITNAKLITWGDPNQILEDQAIYIHQGRIAEIGLQVDLEARYPEAERAVRADLKDIRRNVAWLREAGLIQ